MARPRYLALLRLAVLVLGTGSLAFTVSNGERLSVMLADCEGNYSRQHCPATGGQQVVIGWSGCQTLAKELLTSGSLLLLGVLPVDRPDSM
jgi:hypothetical protein